MTVSSTRKIKESPIVQAEGEIWAYEIDTATWGAVAPATPSAKIFVDDQDKSSVHLSGAASLVGTILTTPLVQNIKRDIRYRLVIYWTEGGQAPSTFCEIIGEKP